jgi:hypothetical protein
LLQGEMTYPHTRDIGNGIEWTGRENADLETELARAWLRPVRVGPGVATLNCRSPGRKQA